MSSPGTTFHIGAIAETVGLSLRSVRYYEEQGLIEPEGRTAGGFRLYTDVQVERLRLIMQMKPLGFSIEEMRELIEARATASAADTSDEDRAAAREKLAEFAAHTDRKIAKLHRAIEAGEGLASSLRKEADAARRPS